MKEIDFLPEWYKSVRRRQFGYRTQYIALGGILLVMVVWHFLGMHSISKAKAQITMNAPELKQAENVSAKLTGLQNKISLLNKKQAVIQKTDSKINLANVLAEMSYLINDRIVLSKVEISAEKFDQQQDKNGSAQVAAVARAARSESAKKLTLTGDVRFKIVMTGVAVQAVDVAILIGKLEESPYFSNVVFSFSRDAQIQAPSGRSPVSQTIFYSSDQGRNSGQKAAASDVQVSRFEISCYLANYHEM